MINRTNYCPKCKDKIVFETKEEADKNVGNPCEKCAPEVKVKKKKPRKKPLKVIEDSVPNDKALSFTVKGNTVSKSNSYRLAVKGKYPYMYKTAACKEYEARVTEAAEKAVDKYEWNISTKNIELRVIVYMPDNRRRDLDNSFKALQDAMNNIVYYDDKQIMKIIAEKKVDKDNPRIKITLKEI